MEDTYHKTTYIFKLSIAILIVATILFMILNNHTQDDSVQKTSKDINTKVQVTVTDSVFSSTGDNSYQILAKQVTQSEDGIYLLDSVSGGYYLDNNNRIEMQAHSGKFDSILDVAHLKNDVKINYLGYDLMSDVLDLDLKDYSVSSSTNIRVKGSGRSIEADSFKTTNKFNQIIFHGDVKADFTLGNNHKR